MIEFKVINTSSYYKKRAIVVIAILISSFLLGISLSKGGLDSVLKKKGFPFYVEVFVALLGFLFLLIFMEASSESDLNVNKIILDKSKLIKGEGGFEVSVSECKKIELKINGNKKKSIHYREINRFGGNNWLKVTDRNDIENTYEILIISQKQEDELIEIVKEWQKINPNVTIGVSDKMFWENFMG